VGIDELLNRALFFFLKPIYDVKERSGSDTDSDILLSDLELGYSIYSILINQINPKFKKNQIKPKL